MNETEMILRVMQEFNCSHEMATLLIKSAQLNNDTETLVNLLQKR